MSGPDQQLMSDWERARRNAFDEWCKRLSEAVLIDYRRRDDLAGAALESVKPIWIALEKNREKLNAMTASKWRKVEIGMFFLGAFINWWISPESILPLNVGSGMMVVAGCTYIAYLVDASIVRATVAALSGQQAAFFNGWLSSGASAGDFWDLRDNFMHGRRLDEHLEDTDEWRAAMQDVEKRRQGLHYEVRAALIERASGTSAPLPSLD